MSYKKRKVTSHRMMYTTILHVQPNIKEVRTHSNTTSMKLAVTSPVNPPYQVLNLE